MIAVICCETFKLVVIILSHPFTVIRVSVYVPIWLYEFPPTVKLSPKQILKLLFEEIVLFIAKFRVAVESHPLLFDPTQL